MELLVLVVVLVVFVVLVYRWASRLHGSARSQPDEFPNYEPTRPATTVQLTRAASKPLEAAGIEVLAFPEEVVDLRSIASKRVAIVGVSHQLSSRDRTNLTVNTWLLRREPENSYDSDAIAVHFVDGKKVGYVSAAQAQRLAVLLDALGSVFAVTGMGSAGTTSTRLWIDLPKIPDLRVFSKTVA